MTSKLKCPLCQTELEDAGIHSAELYFCCTNCYMKQKEKDDNYTASPRIWQALIQATRDLKIARQALKDARIFASTHCIASTVKTIDKALEKIDHKERKENERRCSK